MIFVRLWIIGAKVESKRLRPMKGPHRLFFVSMTNDNKELVNVWVRNIKEFFSYQHMQWENVENRHKSSSFLTCINNSIRLSSTFCASALLILELGVRWKWSSFRRSWMGQELLLWSQQYASRWTLLDIISQLLNVVLCLRIKILNNIKVGYFALWCYQYHNICISISSLIKK